mmetsp:Transcript_59322/g.111807  ORF Transcript_59322/g.111807 Transcript_59322/m.111807 type:complete len:205 (-) Transcript_59322:7-621(-)
MHLLRHLHREVGIILQPLEQRRQRFFLLGRCTCAPCVAIFTIAASIAFTRGRCSRSWTQSAPLTRGLQCCQRAIKTNTSGELPQLLSFRMVANFLHRRKHALQQLRHWYFCASCPVGCHDARCRCLLQGLHALPRLPLVVSKQRCLQRIFAKALRPGPRSEAHALQQLEALAVGRGKLRGAQCVKDFGTGRRLVGRGIGIADSA